MVPRMSIKLPSFGRFALYATVVATCDPKSALLDLIDPGVLPFKVEEQVAVIRMRGRSRTSSL